MKTCPACDEKKNDDDERFCMSCGLDLDKSKSPSNAENLQTPNQETDDNTKVSNISTGKLVFPDKTVFTIDDSQRLVGLADLRKHTKQEPNLISRSHFTIYKKNEKYFIKDGVTNVQNKASKNNTSVNGEELTDDEHELENGDKILVSDVEMLFEV
jgi:pSer/pThr/pTyr-binding forkhead associated (FHA) protein|tara:strand:+ start:2055 stop:2522 length:468 start_codon:yes stop_codon:yes gene_type:complete